MDRDDWNRRYASVPQLWRVDPAGFLGGEVAGLRPGRALDLGAGEGRNAIWLARQGWTVTAVDFADVGLDRGRQAALAAGVASAIDWVWADLADFAPSGPYDLVLMAFVHLPAPQRAGLLQRALGALNPGGTVLVVGYDRANATEGRDGVRDPAILFSPEDILADLAGPGASAAGQPPLVVQRAEQLRVGDAVDAVVRAVKPA